MMVHYHHVRVHRGFTGFDHKAVFIQRAVAAEAVIVGAGDQRPGRRIFRHARAGADIPFFRLIGPRAQNDDVAEGLHRQIAPGQRLLFEAFQTQVV